MATSSSFAQLHSPAFEFELRLEKYAGRIDTFESPGYRPGPVVLTGMAGSFLSSDQVLGTYSDLTAHYRWYSSIPDGIRFNQLDLTIDTNARTFRTVNLAQNDTTVLSGGDGIRFYPSHYCDVPYTESSPGVLHTRILGSAITSYDCLPFLHQYAWYDGAAGKFVTFHATPDSLQEAVLDITVRFPRAEVSMSSIIAEIVWPNPANTSIHVETLGASGFGVYDLLGRLRKTAKEETMDVRALPSGTYWLRTPASSHRIVISHQPYRTGDRYRPCRPLAQTFGGTCSRQPPQKDP